VVESWRKASTLEGILQGSRAHSLKLAVNQQRCITIEVMPCRYVIDVRLGLVISTGWDRVTFEEMKAHQDQLLSDPDFDPTFNQLMDGTAITALEATPTELKTIIGRTFFSPTSRRALLASSLHVLGLGRLMELYSKMEPGREQVCLFHDRESAMRWLGLEVPLV
jgi:hypothetical protein